MKKFFMIVLIFTFVFGMVVAAEAAGYNSDGTIQAQTSGASQGIPHGGFTSGTNKCKSCHAVHAATGTYKLLRSNDLATACDYCHVGGSAITTKKVYVASTYQGEHNIGANIATPDRGTGTLVNANELDCKDCHSGAPHGTNSNADMLVAGTLDAVCTSCHEANAAGSDSHVLDGSPDNTRAWSASDNCRDCHSGTSTDSDIFPHRTNGLNFLRNTYTNGASTTTNLDSVCGDCHTQNGSFTAYTTGVGKTF